MIAQAASPPVTVPRRRDLNRRLAVLRARIRQSRGDRFLYRRAAVIDAVQSPAPGPTLVDAINLPDWIMHDDVVVETIAAVTVVLYYRPVIDQIVDGERLRAIRDQLGEAVLDLACAAAIPPAPLCTSPTATLPPVGNLTRDGRDMLARALPASMAVTVGGACGDANMRNLSNIATALVTTTQGANAETPE